jgi:hypothetical protein
LLAVRFEEWLGKLLDGESVDDVEKLNPAQAGAIVDVA